MATPIAEVLTLKTARALGLNIARTKSTVTCPSFFSSQEAPRKVTNNRPYSVNCVIHTRGLFKKYLIKISRHTANIIKKINDAATAARPSLTRSNIAMALLINFTFTPFLSSASSGSYYVPIAYLTDFNTPQTLPLRGEDLGGDSKNYFDTN